MILYFISSSSIPTGSSSEPLDVPLEDRLETETLTAKPPAAGSPSGKPIVAASTPVPSTPVPSAPLKVSTPDAAPASSHASAPVSAAAPISSNPSSSIPPPMPTNGKVNATFVTLARNTDLWEIVKSIRHVEDRFNRNYHYDWVFLNDKPFDSEFKKVTTSLVSGKTHYGEIPQEHWSFPEWIDQDKARKVREDMHERKIIYGDSTSYRHMCRFESGFFFRQPLMNQYEYYWRVEPSIELYCDIAYDPFKYMQDHGKKYSFVISLYEYVETIPTLWDSAKKFMKKHPGHIVEGNAMDWLSDDKGDTYNHCHFVRFFEIACLLIHTRANIENTISGLISKLGTSIGCDRRPIWITSILLTKMVDSFTNAGEMLQYTPSLPQSSSRRRKSTFSTTSPTTMYHSRIVRRGNSED